MASLAKGVAFRIFEHAVCGAYEDHQEDADPQVEIKTLYFNNCPSLPFRFL
jgi:hypothetical protein